jgi:hypothetical protein
VVRVAPSMVSQAVSNTVWAYATLGLIPGDEARTVLDAAAARVATVMTAQALSTTLWSFLALAATRGVPPPVC